MSAAAPTAWPAGSVLRDIVRGGIAGLMVGVLVGGIGGRLVMRAATLLVPEAIGFRTENGNVIGAITQEGTLFLLLFAGGTSVLLGATAWVVIRPWLPRRIAVRVGVAMLVAVALATPILIQGHNPDFLILRFDARVVAILLALVAAAGAGLAVLDAGLDRLLPRASRLGSLLGAIYAGLAGVGALVGGAALLALLLSDDLRPAGLTLLGVGLATIAWWVAAGPGRDRAAAGPAARRTGAAGRGHGARPRHRDPRGDGGPRHRADPSPRPSRPAFTDRR